MFTVIMSEIRTTETVILCPLTCSTIYTVHTGCNMSKGSLRSHRARGVYSLFAAIFRRLTKVVSVKVDAFCLNKIVLLSKVVGKKRFVC